VLGISREKNVKPARAFQIVRVVCRQFVKHGVAFLPIREVRGSGWGIRPALQRILLSYLHQPFVVEAPRQGTTTQVWQFY
jgi:hypothetical protein